MKKLNKYFFGEEKVPATEMFFFYGIPLIITVIAAFAVISSYTQLQNL